MTRPAPRQSSALYRLLIGLAAGLALTMGLAVAGDAEAASRIYRTVDENGNVVFTDVPPRQNQPGQAVELNEGSSYAPPPTPSNDAASSRMSLEEWLGRGDAPPEDAPERTAYQLLEVASPAHDQAIRDNAGNVTVTARIQPALAAGHAMQVYLDGQLQQTGQAASFQLSNVDRGTHSVELRVVGPGGETLIASSPSVFHLQRRSILLQPGNRTN